MSRQQSINQRQLEELTKNTKTPLNKKTKSLPVDEVALQYILTYIKNKLQLLQKNIELGTQYLEHYYLENNDEEGKGVPIYTPETTYEKMATNIQDMEDEKMVINEFIPEIELIITQKALPTLSLLLKISSFLHNTIKRQEQQYDYDIEQFLQLEDYWKHIEKIIEPHLPTIFQLNMPYILIDADYDNNTSIYVKIYDYVVNTQKILQTQMRMYNECIIIHEMNNPNASDHELMRWKEPYANLYEEREDLNDMILYFQHVFNRSPHPMSP